MYHRLLKLAALAALAREVAKLNGRLDTVDQQQSHHTEALANLIGETGHRRDIWHQLSSLHDDLVKLWGAEHDAFILNAPRRLSALEAQTETDHRRLDTLSRSVGDLETRVQEIAGRGAPDAEDLTT